MQFANTPRISYTLRPTHCDWRSMETYTRIDQYDTTFVNHLKFNIILMSANSSVYARCLFAGNSEILFSLSQLSPPLYVNLSVQHYDRRANSTPVTRDLDVIKNVCRMRTRTCGNFNEIDLRRWKISTVIERFKISRDFKYRLQIQISDTFNQSRDREI